MDELEVNALDSVESMFDEPTVEKETEVETEVEPAETETAEESVPYGLKIKFNGEERTLTEEEARTLAQKGLNYDRFYEPIERLARMNDMSVGDYVNQLNDTQVAYEVDKTKEELLNDPKYENLPEEILEEIASARVRDYMGQRDRVYAEQAQKQTDEAEAQAQREIDHFFEEYPEFRNKGPEELDPKVFEFVKQGYTLLEAYNKFQRMNVQNSQAEAKAKVSQLNETNRKKALGNTSNAGSNETDPFLEGLAYNG